MEDSSVLRSLTQDEFASNKEAPPPLHPEIKLRVEFGRDSQRGTLVLSLHCPNTPPTMPFRIPLRGRTPESVVKDAAHTLHEAAVCVSDNAERLISMIKDAL